MSLVKRQWMILAGAGAAAVGGPVWLLEPEDRAIETPPGVSVTQLQVKPVASLGLALSAPIFSSTRSPVEAVASQTASGEEPPSANAPAPPALVGIVSRARGRGVALVRGSDGETVMIGPGDAVDGWQLAAIERDKAVFAQGSDRRTLTLDFSNKAAAGSAQQQIPAPPPAGEPLALPAARQGMSTNGGQADPPGQSGTHR